MNADAALPPSMQAIVYEGTGGADVLEMRTCDVPAPKPGEVLIKVTHAGVNRPDIAQREGRYPPPPGACLRPGLEVAGHIAALGQGAEGRIGDRVCALVNGGGYAEYCIAQAGHCLQVPEGLSLAEAAALPETLFTVWYNVFERGLAADGETLLVHGGTSGIGTMAILLGRLFGLRVIVTCGTDAKCARAVELGAAHAINYRTQDFVTEAKRITQGDGVDVLLDMVSGDYVARNLACLADNARHITIAVQQGTEATVNMARIMTRRITMTGSTLRPRTDLFKTALASSIRKAVWPLVESGQLRPVMDARFALEDAAAAHRHMESGSHVGKIVLELG
ncbi:NAD(P)H-quinone oxidoreductase [Croceicoccus sp. F390]|uniref:NAD(P)H-quinone oxidoreductase n=1 Tax=Croceicoccus esteveae TaxID=3075597 RepID=A0ABU2ZHL3_9SPHN|nr:NAD(P)H-quinone oxidoreductase [Croceicoccus sp. F390]MDT0576097.1 NAD(P)H-quinone oxidoreductase [Croceicoccus sp. F390]